MTFIRRLVIKDMCVPSQNEDQMTVSSDFVFVWGSILILLYCL